MFGVKYSPQDSDDKIVGFCKEDFSSYQEAEAWVVKHHCCLKCQNVWHRKQQGESLDSDEILTCLTEWEIYNVEKYHEYLSYFDSIVFTVERFLDLTGLHEQDLRECLQTLYNETRENLTYYETQGNKQQTQVQADALAVLEQIILNRE